MYVCACTIYAYVFIYLFIYNFIEMYFTLYLFHTFKLSRSLIFKMVSVARELYNLETDLSKLIFKSIFSLVHKQNFGERFSECMEPHKAGSGLVKPGRVKSQVQPRGEWWPALVLRKL